MMKGESCLMNNLIPPAADKISRDVSTAIAEDLGSGDLTSKLIKIEKSVHTKIISREPAILCGTGWVTEVFKQLNLDIKVNFLKKDGDLIKSNEPICNITGPARGILTGERVGLNFLQTLSGVATKTNKYVNEIAGTKAKIYDTRKTIPGLRYALKYSVSTGGGYNHRMGLFDGILIKENHIAAAGGITSALEQSSQAHGDCSIQIEVENFNQLEEVLVAGGDFILLDNFSVSDLKKCVSMCAGKAILEASGGITFNNVRKVAQTGVDRISIGSLTKDIVAIDFSMTTIE